MNTGKVSFKVLIVSLLAIFLLHSNEGKAQFYSIKTNVLEIATLGTFNLDVSMMVAPHWTLHLDAAYNPWTLKDNKKLKHVLIEPGARYWFWQTYTGGFISMSAVGTRFNGGFKKRYDGYGFGGSFTYGYAWAISKHWNIEAEGGFMAMWTRYSVHECRTCGEILKPKKSYFWPAPKLAVNLVYLF